MEELQAGDLDFWPVYERQGFDMDDQPVYGAVRPGVWNSFGEFQSDFPNHYVHSGIDINGEYDKNANEGDFVAVIADGNIWATHGFASDHCTHEVACKVYIKSVDRRYIYYYAHLNIRADEFGDMDSKVRMQITTAANHDNPDVPPAPETAVVKGELLAGMSEFAYGYSHLHLAIIDTCENYDAISPLDVMVSPYKDEKDPDVEAIEFIEGQSEVLDEPLNCGVLSGNVDVIARMHDIWDTSGDWPGNEQLGVHRAELRIQPLPSIDPVAPVVWQDFDTIPFRCRGPAQGEACTLGVDPIAFNKFPIVQSSFITLMNLFFPSGNANGGPYLALNYTPIMYSTTSPRASCSRDFNNACNPPDYYHRMNSSWGMYDEAGFGGPVNTAALTSGLYQVSVEAFDPYGNAGREASHGHRRQRRPHRDHCGSHDSRSRRRRRRAPVEPRW